MGLEDAGQRQSHTGPLPPCVRIKIQGIVQGVGFRPYVYRLATSLGISGYVKNTSDGVLIEARGEEVQAFVERLPGEAPPLARISSFEFTDLSLNEVIDPPLKGVIDPRLDGVTTPQLYGACGPDVKGACGSFRIIESAEAAPGAFTHVSPDVSVCADCLRELMEPADRRYLYPFINCTNCGPRYSITERIPYDRPNTTMRAFEMCPACRAEYTRPTDRRFHAEPIACPGCGPSLELLGGPEGADPLGGAVRLLKRGAVVAIKGLGGFHLACDATNHDAVRRLRERKRKSNKPFALMSPDIRTIRNFALVSDEEEALLLSPERPIVLLDKLGGGAKKLAASVAPGMGRVGFMLPYTPLHYLLFHHPGVGDTGVGDTNDGGGNFDALVMTSGNMAEEPIVVGNEEAVSRLGGLADAFLLHDRDIFMRLDDSVIRARGDGEGKGGFGFIRRSRGYAPLPVQLSDGGPQVLGAGADIKNTFALIKDKSAVVSQHIGDMENLETLEFYEETLENLKALYRVEPEALAYDPHPGYLSTRWALGQKGIPKLAVQHHYAHIASVMAEHGITRDVLGVALDGTGYGPDGTIWGGEFLVAGIGGFRRAASFRPVRLPGGEAAVREPWRTAVSYMLTALGVDEAMEALRELGFMERYGERMVDTVVRIAASPELSPLSSGAGRLFDAVSALVGVCGTNTFEGEAAMALEAVINEGVRDAVRDAYPFDIIEGVPLEIDFSAALRGIADDVLSAKDTGVVSARFHNTVAAAVVSVLGRLKEETGLNDAALSGGVFQNEYLTRKVTGGLSGIINVHVNRAVPANDGGISLGQAYILRERIKAGIFNSDG